ncbi:MAG: XTP/dITP diphosphatase [Conexivisphaerales archaeon]|nr:XTP/dITP diphosphatase [Conexivisphaerales archaeon]
MQIIFLTKNDNKIREANEALLNYGIKLTAAPENVQKLEIQDEHVENVALYAAKTAYKKLKRAFVVEDDGLFINALNNFPGPYTAYALKSIGIKGILKLMENIENRGAYFQSAVVLQLLGRFFLFTKKVHGTISLIPKGNAGFGFDPIFIPSGYDITYAEMDLKEKSSISHRAGAFKEMASFLNNYYKKYYENYTK